MTLPASPARERQRQLRSMAADRGRCPLVEAGDRRAPDHGLGTRRPEDTAQRAPEEPQGSTSPTPIRASEKICVIDIDVVPVRDESYEADEISVEILAERAYVGSDLVRQLTLRTLITLSPPEQGWDRYKDIYSNTLPNPATRPHESPLSRHWLPTKHWPNPCRGITLTTPIGKTWPAAPSRARPFAPCAASTSYPRRTTTHYPVVRPAGSDTLHCRPTRTMVTCRT